MRANARSDIPFVAKSAPDGSCVFPWLPSDTHFDVVNKASLNFDKAQRLNAHGYPQGFEVHRICMPREAFLVLHDDHPGDLKHYELLLSAFTSDLRGCPSLAIPFALLVTETDAGVFKPCGWLMDDVGEVTLAEWIHTAAQRCSGEAGSSSEEGDEASALMIMMSNIADAIHCLHRHGIVHGLIGPASVWVSRRGAQLVYLGLPADAVGNFKDDVRQFHEMFQVCLDMLPHVPSARHALDTGSAGAMLTLSQKMRPTGVDVRRFVMNFLEHVSSSCAPCDQPVLMTATSDTINICQQLLNVATQRLKRDASNTSAVLRIDGGAAWRCARDCSVLLDMLLDSVGPTTMMGNANCDSDCLVFEARLVSLDVRLASWKSAWIDDAYRAALTVLEDPHLSAERAARVKARVLRAQRLLQVTASDAFLNEPSSSFELLWEQAATESEHVDREHLQRALKLYDHMLDKEQGVLGEQPLLVALTLEHKAYALKQYLRYYTGRYVFADVDKLAQVYDEALNTLRPLLGDEHVALVPLLEGKANALEMSHQIDAALQTVDEALSLAQRLSMVGPDHPWVAYLLAHKAWMAQYHQSVDGNQKMLALYDDATSIVTASLGPNHPQMATIIVEKGAATCCLGGSSQETLALYGEALRILQLCRSNTVAGVLTLKADAHLSVLQPDRDGILAANHALDDALAIYRAKHGTINFFFAELLRKKVKALLDLGDRDGLIKALCICQEEVAIRRALPPVDKVEVATALRWRASAFEQLGEWSEAISTYDEALQNGALSLGTEIRFDKATALRRLGDEESLRKAVRVYDNLLLIAHYEFARSLDNHLIQIMTNKADVLVQLGSYQDLLRAVPIYRDILAVRKDDFEIMDKIAAALERLGDRLQWAAELRATARRLRSESVVRNAGIAFQARGYSTRASNEKVQ